MPKSLEQRDAAWNRRALTAAQQQGQAAPPIAPVGVEAIREAFDEISGLCRHLRQGGPVPEDLQDLSDALHEAVGIAANMLHALAQHPAAGAEMEFDGTDREVLREFIRICREHKPVGPWPGERVCKAIERAMDNEKPFRFIAEADMAPERAPSMKDADRMLSGPRRAAQQAEAVMAEPYLAAAAELQPVQRPADAPRYIELANPAAEDDPDAAARAYAARMGDRWEHMGEEARQRARELATRHHEPKSCKHNFRRDEDHGGACCQLCGEVKL